MTQDKKKYLHGIAVIRLNPEKLSCIYIYMYCIHVKLVITVPSHTLAHYCDVIMDAVASQITSLMIVYWTVYSDADQNKHQSSVSLAFVWGIHRGTVNSPHKWPVTREMFPFDDVIMTKCSNHQALYSPWTSGVGRYHLGWIILIVIFG